MEAVHNLEKTIAEWYKSAPHLPKGGREWLADNVWWLALVGAILSVLGLFTIVPLFLAALALTAAVVPYAVTYYQGAFGIAWLGFLISIVSYIATALLLAVAVKPLKVKSKKGWDFLFLSYVINFGLSVIGALVALNVFGVVGALIGAAIGGYFLFEIYEYFGVKHKSEPKKVAEKKS